MVVDLREEYITDKQNVFTVFESLIRNLIPKEPHPAELYFDFSRRCLIPRPGIYIYIYIFLSILLF